MAAKARSDATLRNLPEDRQAQIAEWCEKANDMGEDGKPIPKTGGLAYAKEQLAADGVNVSLDTLSRFYRSWLDEQTFKRASGRAQEIEQMLVRQFPDATPEKIAAAGQLVFTMEASNAGDSKTFVALEQLRLSQNIAKSEGEIAKAKLEIAERKLVQKDRDFGLAREKFVSESCEKILKAARDPSTREIAESSTLSNSEKIAAIRKAYFADIDAVNVELPE
jgi:hypothetical protein